MAVAHVPIGRIQLARPRIRWARVAVWTMVVLALGAATAILMTTSAPQRVKQDANNLISPWDKSLAPPQYTQVSRSSIKPLPNIPAVAVPLQPTQSRHHRHYRHYRHYKHYPVSSSAVAQGEGSPVGSQDN